MATLRHLVLVVAMTASPDTQLDLATIEQRLVDGRPGDWKIVGGKTGAYSSGTAVRIGSDYSGHCLTYAAQEIGIDLGHVADCTRTVGGANVTFEKEGGGTIRFGDIVALGVTHGSKRAYLCYGVRDDGINLDWGERSEDCRQRDGSKGHDARQWQLVPPAGSSRKIGDAVGLSDRFALHNRVAGQALVKCARIYNGGPRPTWLAGDLKWRKDCMHHELVWTHRELLRKLGEDPEKLALQSVPYSLRSVLEALL